MIVNVCLKFNDVVYWFQNEWISFKEFISTIILRILENPNGELSKFIYIYFPAVE